MGFDVRSLLVLQQKSAGYTSSPCVVVRVECCS
jgi:hypothetical protein